MARAFNPFALGRGNAVMSLDSSTWPERVFGRLILEQVRQLDETMPDESAWHEFDPQVRLHLLASLRENAANLHEMRALLPLFTEKRGPLHLGGADRTGRKSAGACRP